MDAGGDVIGISHISKRFDDLVAIHDASLTVRAGEIHALVGENGAGKTTLMNILYGLLPRDSGDIRLRGEPVNFTGLRKRSRLVSAWCINTSSSLLRSRWPRTSFLGQSR